MILRCCKAFKNQGYEGSSWKCKRHRPWEELRYFKDFSQEVTNN